ncbi:uncharacterized protein SCDLUD_003131 [Saccharomycodes ludwigii]|uniref:uncharacterized protein n=1 Tax=Saccharomycodes ludwigii TaxID=36035 RepID=UPI001E84BCEF|nr:hypothetical protein SCDLUD_003131 [Saccharomycodes ludwigii]KAH3900161.1 hypothetical protein SCDLUD_003131 [Saccharomycodes ludwigii]
MPSYVDDDDYYCYSDDNNQNDNGIPDFVDEQDFDDYLTDEEYNLMGDLFPKIVKELKDYKGWDNLMVKLIIFKNNFDFNKSILELKKKCKKKKLISTYNDTVKPQYVEKSNKEIASNLKKGMLLLL